MDRTLRLATHVQGLLSFLSPLTGKRRALVALLMTVLGLAAPTSATAMAQRTGDFELEMDAPWRMEPRGTSLQYGAIPIQASIHDADQPRTAADQMLQRIITVTQGYPAAQVIFAYLEGPIDALLGPADEILAWFGLDVVPHGELPPVVTLDRFESLFIDEEINGSFVRRQTFTLANIHEVEKTVGLWAFDAAQWGPEANDVPPTRPTHSLCRRWQGQDCSTFAALRPTSEWHLTAMYTPTTTTPGSDVRLRTILRVRTFRNGVASVHNYERILTVHLGETALPKFGTDWAYGDLHYHSQGTDNDGESGYSYRGTLQAMAGMGLDFAFATDHASNSRQIGSASPVFSDELVRPLTRGLRDMSPDRFAFGIDLLNGSTGANRQVTSFPRGTGVGSELVASQLFLGGEVDIVPEMLPGETSSYRFCLNLPGFLKGLDQKDFWPEDFWCSEGRHAAPYQENGMVKTMPDGRLLLRDVQGPDGGRLLSTHFYARQHLLHLPVDGQRKSAFIASNTSKYGGGTRRLGEILNVELAQRQKGYIFLAHPFADSFGDGVGALGPDLVAYTQTQLNDAFDSPYVLGLQIWNEDSLSSAKANDAQPFPSPLWEDQHQPFNFDNFRKWDLLQLQGLDKARTASLPWLPSGKPRRLFAAGGSDAHGDFNYRREGYLLGTDKVNDTAIGKPRNLVHVGEAEGSTISTLAGLGRPFSQAQVVDGLRSGNFAITDGPAVRLLVDVNKNGVIDASDVPMGGVHHQIAGPFQVIVEWKSSDEFAPVGEIDLLVGGWADGMIDGMVYTRAYDGPIANFENSFIQPGTRKVFVRTPNQPYWYDPNPQNALYVRPAPGEAYHGQRVITIDPALYPVGIAACVGSTTGTSGTPIRTSIAISPLVATSTSGGTTTTTSNGGVVYLNDSFGDQLENEDLPPSGCISREFQNAKTPNRMFVRAEVRNQPAPDSSAFCDDQPLTDLQACVRRTAYTNPVWVVEPCTTVFACGVSNSALDNLVGGVTTVGGSGGSTDPVTGTLGTTVGTISATLQLSPTTSTTGTGTTITPTTTTTLSTTPTTTTTTTTTTTSFQLMTR